LQTGRGPAPYELRYGDLLAAVWLKIGDPGQWPELADELNQTANGDGSALANTFEPARGFLLSALVPAVALQCSNKPL
jgi:hypothetical protein